MSLFSSAPSKESDDLFPVEQGTGKTPIVGAVGTYHLNNEEIKQYDGVADTIQQPEDGLPPTHESLEARLGSVVDNAIEEHDFPERLKEPMLRALLKWPDVWRDELLWEDGAAKVEPMKVQFKSSEPHSQLPIKQPGPKAAFVREFTNKMVDKGFGYSNPQSVYSNRAFAVGKPGKPGKYRLVCDLRAANANTVKVDFGMTDTCAMFR